MMSVASLEINKAPNVQKEPYSPGTHLLLDFYGAKFLEDETIIRRALQDAAEACGATVLQIRLHHFGEGHGITGVALLAESHISIHSWPENHYAALDVFVCGNCDASAAIAPLKAALQPERIETRELKRGSLLSAEQSPSLKKLARLENI